ncbi:MAG: TRAP transporter small permease [Candidatus Onthomonas sp.]
MLDLYEELMDFLDKIVKVLCIALAAVMTLIVMMQVFTRLCPWVPTPSWTEELARYVMIYMAFVGASHGIKEWDNVNVDIVLNAMPKKMRWVVDVLIKVLVLAFMVIVSVMAVQTFCKVGWSQKSPSLRTHMFYFQFAIILGCILCCVQCVGIILKDLRKRGK